MKVRLRLLGTPRLEAGGEVTGLPLDRPASLGYYLAQRGDWVRRGELAYLYNPEADEASAFNNLRKLVFRLKQQGWAEALEAEPTRLRLNLPTDVQAFRAALERQDWAEALEHYGGTFLGGLAFPDLSGYEAWLELERQDLSRAWRGASLEQVRLLEGRADWPQAEQWLGRLLKTDPLDEDAVQALLRVLQGAGKVAQAREAYERFHRDLGRELGVEPLESTRALADSLRSAPVVVSVEATRPKHNLPIASTRFIGRKRELEALSRLLSNPDCRLLTVVGLGGIGKTRLVLELANQQTEGFADGVWLVALSGVVGADLLVSSMASALGLVFSGSSNPKVQLLNYLRAKQSLLVLDNFEHLLEGGLLLEELLAQAPGLKLLVTSRVALETGSEWLYDLEGLPYPPPHTDQDLDGFDSVRLFINRAERLSNQFLVTPTELEAIAELTRKVQGMPLALELAATWVRGLSVGEILAQLSRSFELFQTTQRDLPERHRNLQAILEYSWQLLSGAEQTVLTQLSVFRGGCTLEAAQAVAGAHLGLLLRFINQALVRRSESGRYEMHELVRQFAAERLEGRLEAQTYQHFCQFFLDLLYTQGKTVRMGSQKEAVSAWRAEINNVFSAIDYLAARGQLDQLKGVLLEFYAIVELLGLLPTGVERVDALLGAMGAQATEDAALKGRLKAVRAYFLIKLGRAEESSTEARESIALLEGEGPSDYLGVTHFSLGLGQNLYGSHAEAIATYQQALAIFESTGNKSETCRALSRIASVYKNLDQLGESDRYYQQALEVAAEAGDLTERGLILNSYGVNFESSGRIEEAIQHYHESLRICDRVGHLRGKSAALTNLGHLHEVRLGEYQKARDYYQQSIEIKTILGEPVAISISMTNLADVLYALGETNKGHRFNLKAIDLTLGAKALMYTARVIWSFSRFFATQGQLDQGLFLAFFLTQTQESEQWVRDEVRDYLADHSSRLEPAPLQLLKHQADKLDYSQIAQWIKESVASALEKSN